MPTPSPSPWWHPEQHADRRPFLAARGRITRAVRAWFEARAFVEVETAALTVSPGNETHLHAFAELTDPVEQRRRLQIEMDEKARIYGERYPMDEDFLSALELMPPASGSALGFDRLVMLATGAARIEQVLWTPLPDAP